MTFPVESELRAVFSDAALLEDRAAVQLSEFRHGSANELISPVNSRCREAAVNFARSSVGLEGFKPTKVAEARARQFIKGDIQLADFVQVQPDAEQAHNR